MRPCHQRQLAGQDVHDNLFIRGAGNPSVPRIRPAHPLVLCGPSEPRADRRIFLTANFPS